MTGTTHIDAGYLKPFLDGPLFLYGVGDEPRTLSDLAMSRFSAYLRSKKEWWKHYRDHTFLQKWTEECSSTKWKVVSSGGKELEIVLSRKQIEYVLDELAGYDLLRDPSNGAQVSCFERIWESDCLFSSDDQSKIQSSVETMRFHYVGPQQMRRFLINPYRYCLIYDRIGRHGKMPTDNTTQDRDFCVSTFSACLPTDYHVPPTGGVAKRSSYINGVNCVDPEFTDVYASLDGVLKAFIPLFEKVLTDLHRNHPLPQRIIGTCHYSEWDEPESPDFSDDEEALSSYLNDLKLWSLHRPINLPDVPASGYPENLHRRLFHVSLAGKTLQVYYSLIEYELDEETVTLPPASWTVEGMKNESVVACGYHVCSLENLRNLRMDFRMAVTSPRKFMYGDVGATSRTWGLDNEDPCNQHLGSTLLRTGLALAFPNIYQHRLSSITLEDFDKPGRLTLLGLFLVDPDIDPIPSTTSISPQNKQWISQAVEKFIDPRLPHEVVDLIISYLDFLPTKEQADAEEKAMFLERKAFQTLLDEHYFSLRFNARNGEW